MAATKHNFYIIADGDGIGDRLEILLLDNKLAEAKQFSMAIHSGIKKLAKLLIDVPNTQLIFCGGDRHPHICAK